MNLSTVPFSERIASVAIVIKRVIWSFLPLVAGIPVFVGILRRHSHWRKRAARSNVTLAMAIVAVMLLAFLLSRLPDTHDDGMTYHLAAPESFLMQHRIYAEPGSVTWHMPLGLEMVMTPLFALGGVQAAKLANLVVLLALLGMAARLARYLLPNSLSKVGMHAAFLVCTSGIVLMDAWQGKNNLALTTYVIGALWCGLRSEGKWGRWMALAAIFSGLAYGIKQTGAIYVFALTGALLVGARGRLPARVWLGSIGLGLLAGGGWLVQSWLYLGNPFHPFLSGIFPDIAWNPSLQRVFLEEAGSLLGQFADPWMNWILLPLLGLGSYNGSAAIMAFGPLAFFGTEFHRSKMVRVWAAIAILCWIPGYRDPRFLLPVIYCVAVVIPGLYANWLSSARRATIAVAYAAGFLIVVLLTANTIGFDGWRFLCGQMGEERFMIGRTGNTERMQSYLNANSLRRDVICLSGGDRRLGYRRRTRCSFRKAIPPLLLKVAGLSANADDMRRHMRQMGITLIAHNLTEGMFTQSRMPRFPAYNERGMRILGEFCRRYLRLEWRSERDDPANGIWYVYRVIIPGGKSREPLATIPDAEACFRPYIAALKAKDYRGALRVLRPTVAIAEDEIYVHSLLGKCYAALGDYRGAIGELRPGISVGFRTETNMNDYGFALNNIRDDAGAIRAFAQAWLFNRSDSSLVGFANALYNRASAAYRSGSYHKALRDLDVSSYLRQWDPLAPTLAAMACAKMGRRKEALLWIDRARSRAPENQDVMAVNRELRGGK